MNLNAQKKLPNELCVKLAFPQNNFTNNQQTLCDIAQIIIFVY